MDRRVRKTKKAIRDAFLEELENKYPEQIKVSDICRKADINRGTFYLHYVDVMDLMDEFEKEYMDEIIDISLSSGGGSNMEEHKKILQKIFEYVFHNRLLSRIIYRNEHHAVYTTRMADEMAKKIFREGLDYESLKYKATFFCYGYYGVIQKWILDGCDVPPEELAKRVAKYYF